MYRILVLLFGVFLLNLSARADFLYDYTDTGGTHLAFQLTVFENVGTIASPDLDISIIEGVAGTATVLFNGNAGGDCEIGNLGPFPNASCGCIFYQAPFPLPNHGFGFSGLMPFSGPGTFTDNTGIFATLVITEVPQRPLCQSRVLSS
jgi:hypothetical protein